MQHLVVDGNPIAAGMLVEADHRFIEGGGTVVVTDGNNTKIELCYDGLDVVKITDNNTGGVIDDGLAVTVIIGLVLTVLVLVVALALVLRVRRMNTAVNPEQWTATPANNDGRLIIKTAQTVGVFLSYRQQCDSDLVTSVYDKLAAKKHEVGLGDTMHVFLDKRSLKPGFDWKAGFIQGIKDCQVFVPVISLTSDREWGSLVRMLEVTRNQPKSINQ